VGPTPAVFLNGFEAQPDTENAMARAAANQRSLMDSPAKKAGVDGKQTGPTWATPTISRDRQRSNCPDPYAHL